MNWTKPRWVLPDSKTLVKLGDSANDMLLRDSESPKEEDITSCT